MNQKKQVKTEADALTSLLEGFSNIAGDMKGLPEKLKDIPRELTRDPDGWWDMVLNQMFAEHDMTSLIMSGLFYQSVREDKPIYTFMYNYGKLSLDGVKPEADDYSEVVENKALSLIKDIRGISGLKPSIVNKKYIVDKGHASTCHVSKDTYINVNVYPAREGRVVIFNAISYDEAIINKVCEIARKYVDIEPDNPELFIISEDDDGHPMLQGIGKPGIDIVRDNYSDEVLKGFDYVKEQLVKEDPFGRLVILHGEPGTGKTYLVRSLINSLDLSRATFVYLPPEFLTKFSTPSLTKIFLDATAEGHSLILLIEDGDEVLVPRQADNIGGISKLLNLADGFVGNLLDIRIVVTTNTSKLDIDKALRRPGRLCRIIEVGELKSEDCARIFKRETGDDIPQAMSGTLAEVYAAVTEYKNGGGNTGDANKSKVGFKK